MLVCCSDGVEPNKWRWRRIAGVVTFPLVIIDPRFMSLSAHFHKQWLMFNEEPHTKPTQTHARQPVKNHVHNRQRITHENGKESRPESTKNHPQNRHENGKESHTKPAQTHTSTHKNGKVPHPKTAKNNAQKCQWTCVKTMAIGAPKQIAVFTLRAGSKPRSPTNKKPRSRFWDDLF